MLKKQIVNFIDKAVQLTRNRLQRPRVLVLGIYLANKSNTIKHLVSELSRSKRFDIRQRWAALNGAPPTSRVRGVTALAAQGFVQKFCLINQLMAGLQLADFDYLLVCDDDITLPKGFVDRFIQYQCEYDFSIAQPARTHNSYLDHSIVEVVDGLEARQTRFVEIGPIFSIRKDAFNLLIPFDEEAPMGWGLDFVWPVQLQGLDLKMGIIDAVPADHSLRKPFTQYDGNKANDEMQAYLSRRKHLRPEDAFIVLNEFGKRKDRPLAL